MKMPKKKNKSCEESNERKLISAKELEGFLMNNIVREFMEGLFADTPYAPPSITYRWWGYNGDIYDFGYRYKEDTPCHWEIFTRKNNASGDNVNIKIYNDHIVFMKESSEFQAVRFNRMLKLFNDLAKEFDLKKFYDTEESEALQEVAKTEINESKITEGEMKMENEENYIKMDGEKDSFEGGAIRYTKKGKGRYDLIPSQQIHDILDYAKLNWDSIVGKDDDFCSIHNVLMSAYPDADDLTYDNYIEIIINIVRYCYIVASNNQIFDAFMMGFVKMLKDLAIHYEMGAEKYGVDNWKNGIPETKGERGGSFRDSGLRHLQQLLDGKTDEPHQIAAIWNFIGAMYVRKHQDNKTDEHAGLKESNIENRQTTIDTISHINGDKDEIIIDLSHPDSRFGNVCVISTNGNKFNVSFGTDYNHIQTYSLNKDKISVSRSVTYFDGLREESYTISGMNSLNDEHVKIDLSRSFSFEDKNGKSSVTARIYKGFHIESESDPLCIFFRVEHESYPKLIENKLWDKLYDDAFKDIVTDIRPV